MFEKDLTEWKQIEKEFATRLLKWDVTDIMFSQWKFPEWDVKACFNKNGQQERKTFEVKYDKKSDETGNVWFEYMCNWHPSGIFKSQADYIVYKVWWEFYYCDRLKLLIELSKCLKQDVYGGDRDMSQMFLVKKEVFKLLFNKI